MNNSVHLSPKRVIVIGASTGGFDGIKKIVRSLPANFRTPILIVWHMAPDVQGILPNVLNKFHTVAASNAVDNEPIRPNHIYIAPPDHHLIIEDDLIRITHGPKENRFRPAVDPLFRSAAYSYGHQVIGIILSGALDDGTAGLWRIKAGGGITIVQDPQDAEMPSMPENALCSVEVDYCIPVADIADLLVKLEDQHIPENDMVMKDEKTKIEIGIACEENALERGSLTIGELSPFACPECHGVLSRIIDGNIARFRCHTGHAYSIDTLMSSLTEKIEDSLYGALRGMDESILLLNHMSDHYAENNDISQAALYFKKAQDLMTRSDTIRRTVFTHEPLTKSQLRYEADKDLQLHAEP